MLNSFRDLSTSVFCKGKYHIKKLRIQMKTIFFLLILFANNITAQTPDPASFFPHQVGNTWEYDYPDRNPSYVIEKFTKDSIGLDGSIYVEKNNSRILGWEYKIQGFDIYYLPERQTVNFLRYKLDGDSGDVWIARNNGTGNVEIARLEEVFNAFVFGIPVVVKKISFYASALDDTLNTGLWHSSYYLASGFGLVLVEAEGMYYNYVQKLRGCLINGVAYGSLVSVNNNNEVISDFILEQNYPNPFNSQTRIEYRVPEYAYIRLEIFNILGEKVKTLVDQYKPAGNYAVEFNADALSAGTYIYRLFTGRTFISKKMNHLK